ncbi:4-hydroxybenzoate octaprenyltransferase [Rhodovastum atsumiense]|uniref:4-hydroxybenzoate octaprenyltransferase n=1 Tax=Rhodovastum atsumiense TaxID=504468 RepID=A0A5M6IRQ4_9PROT|nr:4-hydroxybenzoate octaprenyltransferase [Rhodovastum atsumiense]KAA5610980.1 4-hydroxybenzoate octaprenyltransferase [Rhodovastum atsumiense]CAH2600242.1 4-hydroxybenzoate octaprenyltransferase [Rhodovastum atsumiense]
MSAATDPTPLGGHTDIVTGGWIGRLPRKLVPYALLGRFDRPIGIWLLFLPGLWSILLAQASPGYSAWLIVLFFIGSVLMRGAGCVVNDMWDRDMDRRVTRTAGRPLASRALSMFQALVFLAALCTPSLLILLQLHPTAQILGVSSLLLVLLYPLAKRVTWWPQMMLGFTFGWGAPMGYAAASGRLDWAPVALYLGTITWILAYDTIYAHQDREDDALIGVRSTARLWNEQTRPFVAVCYGITVAMLALAGWLAGLSWVYFVALILPAGLLARQVIRVDIHDSPLCLALFRSNREVGLAVALAILLGRL